MSHHDSISMSFPKHADLVLHPVKPGPGISPYLDVLIIDVIICEVLASPKGNPNVHILLEGGHVMELANEKSVSSVRTRHFV